jgi:hypothetical protein
MFIIGILFSWILFGAVILIASFIAVIGYDVVKQAQLEILESITEAKNAK